MTGVSQMSVRLLNDTRNFDDARKGETVVPEDLVDWYGRYRMPGQGASVEALRASTDNLTKWQALTEAWDKRLSEIMGRSWAHHHFTEFGSLVEARVAEGAMTPGMGAAMTEAIGDIVAALQNPIGLSERYIQNLARGTTVESAVEQQLAWLAARPLIAAQEARAQKSALDLAGQSPGARERHAVDEAR